MVTKTKSNQKLFKLNRDLKNEDFCITGKLINSIPRKKDKTLTLASRNRQENVIQLMSIKTIKSNDSNDKKQNVKINKIEKENFSCFCSIFK